MSIEFNKTKVDSYIGILIAISFGVGVVIFLTINGGEEVSGKQWLAVVIIALCWIMKILIPFLYSISIQRKRDR